MAVTFTLDVEHGEDTPAVVRLSGELDMATAPQVRDCIDRLIAAGWPHIVVDLRDLSFCDSAGLTTFIQGDKHCAANGGWLRLTHPEGQVARVMELSGVLPLLQHGVDDQPPT